jgi:hypothetical protein
MALPLAALAAAGLFNAAHATFPGENGVIVFDSPTGTEPEVIKRVSPGNSAVTSLASGRQPSVSPNGKKIAFTKDHDIYVMNIDGSNVIQLTNDHYSYSPAWLPDGSKLAYGRFAPPSNVFTVWTMNPDGTGKTFVRGLDPGNSPLKFNFTWSPVYSTLFAFDGGSGVKIGNTLNPDIQPRAPEGRTPSWEPDGKTILFAQSNNQFEVVADDESPRALAVPPNGTVGGVNAVSPDGAFVAGGDATHNMELRSRARNGSTPNNFTWETSAGKADWSRMPKNCYETTPQGGGEIVAGDVDFYATQCAIAVMPDDGLSNGILKQVIAVGPDKLLYHRALKTNPSGGAPTWGGFARVPGVGLNPNGILAKKIAIAASRNGSSQIVIVNANDNLVYHAMRYANGTWSGFNPLDGDEGAPNFAARDVAITINASTPTSPGNAQVIANAFGLGAVFHRVRWAAGNWTPFQMVPGSYGSTNELAIAADESGNANVLATSGNGKILQVLRYAAGNWSNWLYAGLPAGTTLAASSDVAVTRTLSGTAQMMFTDAAGNVLLQERPTPNEPSSWQSQVPTTQIANTVGRAVSISAGATTDSSSQLLLTRTFPQ